MGNSEVGHLNIGAGRVVYQDLSRVDVDIEDGSFYTNPALSKAVASAKQNDSALHIMGLLSPGGVHSHENHIFSHAGNGRAQRSEKGLSARIP